MVIAYEFKSHSYLVPCLFLSVWFHVVKLPFTPTLSLMSEFGFTSLHTPWQWQNLGHSLYMMKIMEASRTYLCNYWWSPLLIGLLVQPLTPERCSLLQESDRWRCSSLWWCSIVFGCLQVRWLDRSSLTYGHPAWARSNGQQWCWHQLPEGWWLL